ncbi:hypothetical protein, partial [Mesorhizobium sp.]|uniref:hypothetical protein n=1 Tax=Mesorhizobium sp. TaxID=1871066 RepID=UPI0025FE4386
EQGAKRRGADHRIHSVTSKRRPTMQNSAPLRSPAKVTEWILGSARRFASLRPWMTTSRRLRPIAKLGIETKGEILAAPTATGSTRFQTSLA